MKYCSICGVPLPTNLDEFGDAGCELCQSCALGDVMPGEFPTAEEAMQDFFDLLDDDELP